eukprot:TRINITY_DN34585_c0_g1_i1.p1 TRINITY_DN34585_c0_g1~~TRINITY_DN34585_c0_g1_i1.p1  ORF type:complete len:463 (-),score=99.78 TRINITY_DN34585_c0_g1_i1:200-1588(-)
MAENDDDVPEGAQCLICHDALLFQSACALKCGHIYHTACCHQWFEVGRGSCPQCKKVARTDDLRVLEFEMAEMTPQAIQDAQRLRAACAEDRQRIYETATAQLEEAEQAIVQVAEDLEEMQRATQDHKRARKELEKQARKDEEEIARLLREHEEKVKKCTEVQEFIDGELGRNTRKLPVPQAREADDDVREERRKLAKMRPQERLQQLHGALVAARRQDVESSALLRERETSLAQVEAELVVCRQQEAKLLREVRERREHAKRGVFASNAGDSERNQRSKVDGHLDGSITRGSAGGSGAAAVIAGNRGGSNAAAADVLRGGGRGASGGTFGPPLFGAKDSGGAGFDGSSSINRSAKVGDVGRGGNNTNAGGTIGVDASAGGARGKFGALLGGGSGRANTAGASSMASGCASGGKFGALLGAGSGGSLSARGASANAKVSSTTSGLLLSRQNSLRMRYSDRAD